MRVSFVPDYMVLNATDETIITLNPKVAHKKLKNKRKKIQEREQREA